MNEKIINMPEPLDVLAERFRLAYKRSVKSHNEWVETTLEMASALWDARRQFDADQAFSVWLVQNQLDEHDKNDRAALIKMGEHIELARKVLLGTKLTWLRRIWEDELAPRVRELSNPDKIGIEPEKEQKPAEIPAESGSGQAKLGAKENETVPVSPMAKRNPLSQKPRGQEVWLLYNNHSTKSALNKAVTGRNGQEVWSLILEAIDHGFLRPNEDASHTFSARLLFTGSPKKSSLSQLDLAIPTDRKRVQEVIMPAAIANKKAVLSDPHRIEEIIETYRRTQNLAAQKEAKAREISEAVNQMPGTQQQVVAFGEYLWPTTNDGYDYDQLRAAVWYFRGMEGFLRGGRDNSVESIALMIRNSIKWLSEYATYRSDQKRMSAIFTLVRRISVAWEQNPQGECKWPGYPMGEEGKW
jgi:hypothetical protein